MGKSNTFDNAFLSLVFNAQPIVGIALNATASPLTNLYVSLHTADPTSAGNQSSSETNYSAYARIAVTRNSGGWSISNNTVTPVSAVVFATCTGGTATIVAWGVGYSASGANTLLYSGTVTPNIAVQSGVVPTLLNTTNITES
jgi:hypothetical protein